MGSMARDKGPEWKDSSSRGSLRSPLTSNAIPPACPWRFARPCSYKSLAMLDYTRRNQYAEEREDTETQREFERVLPNFDKLGRWDNLKDTVAAKFEEVGMDHGATYLHSV